jgi:CheY-like chemotaxis protein
MVRHHYHHLLSKPRTATIDTLTIARIRAGLEALSVLRSGPNAIDLVLTDVMMPFLDGFGLLKELRYDTRHTRHTRHTLIMAR